MSARRKARARDTAAAVIGAGGVPRSLLVGRCIEVWAESDAANPPYSAWRRFSDVRRWWLSLAGMTPSEASQLIPSGSPWSAPFLISQGRAAVAAKRLARAGATVDDLLELRHEASRLYEATAAASAQRRK